MNHGLRIIIGLAFVMGSVLLLPFFSKRIEEELESFLFAMGLISVSIAGLWSKELICKTLEEPIAITLAVFIAGSIFRLVDHKITIWTHSLVDRIGLRPVLIIVVAGLALLSSIITAIIAALLLAEIVTSFRISRQAKIRVIVIGCFAIGMGAALSPIGEPLATIAVAKLAGSPYHAGFLFLFNLVGYWVIPSVLGLAVLVAVITKSDHPNSTMIVKESESIMRVIFRAAKTYIFVMGLVLLGTGFSPVVDSYLVKIPPTALYWINTVSAFLDNATLTAAEFSPKLPPATLKYMLISLLISGGMLIPGNIPNIVCAGKSIYEKLQIAG